MAFMVLGEVDRMSPDMVDRESIETLRKLLIGPEEVFFFNCKLCGAQRLSTIVDPGVLMYGDYECFDECAKCVTPRRPKTTPPPLYFRPGCMVFAPITHRNKKTMWPGIIEPCPEGEEGWRIEGKRPGSTHAFFVTFIYGSQDNRQWFGGFFKAKDIVPFMEMDSVAGQPFCDEELKAVHADSLHEARQTIRMTLKERLLKFSFVAHVARMTNRSLDNAENEEIERRKQMAEVDAEARWERSQIETSTPRPTSSCRRSSRCNPGP